MAKDTKDTATPSEPTDAEVPATTTTAGDVEPTGIAPDAVEAPVAETDPQEDKPVGAVEVHTVEPQPVDRVQGIVKVEGSVPAQIVGPAQPTERHVPVREAQYHTDRVILDTSDPLAVQPLHSNDDLPSLDGRKTAEEQFAQQS